MPNELRSLETWLVIGAYSLLWLLVAFWARTLLKHSLGELAARRKSSALAVLAQSVPRPVGVAVFLAGLDFGVRWLPVTEATKTTLRHDVPVGLGIVGIAIAMRIAFRAMQAYGQSNPDLQSATGIGRAIVWVLGLAAMAILVSEALGISIAPALTALGVGSLAVALALQDTLSNFFAGLYLLVDRPVRRGDFVQLDSLHEGFIESIGWRSTHLRTLADDLVVVPNATLSKSVFTTFRGPNPRLGIEARIDVAASADPAMVEGLLLEEAKRATEIPGVAPDPAPYVRLSPGAVNGTLGFTVYAQVGSFARQGAAQHELRKRVLLRLRAANVPMSGRGMPS